MLNKISDFDSDLCRFELLFFEDNVFTRYSMLVCSLNIQFIYLSIILTRVTYL